MTRPAGNRVAIVVLVATVVGIPAAILGYQYGLRPLLADHRIVDITASAPENGGFSPDLVRLEVGETATMRFMADDVTHGIAIGPGLGIDLGQIDPGHTGEVNVTFNEPGIYTYYCNTWCSVDHWRMRGIIEVTGNGSGPGPTTEDDDPILAVLERDLIDIDAEPDVIAGLSFDRDRGRSTIEALEIPTDLEDPAWRLSHSPADGTALLAEANPQTPPDLLQDVVAYVWSAEPPTASSVDLYRKNCAACHGENGDGDGPAAGTTLEEPISFSDVAWLRRGDIWYAKIRRGGMGTDMPNFGTLFTPEETRQLVSYLWALALDTESR
jgi:plastocyanin